MPLNKNKNMMKMKFKNKYLNILNIYFEFFYEIKNKLFNLKLILINFIIIYFYFILIQKNKINYIL